MLAPPTQPRTRVLCLNNAIRLLNTYEVFCALPHANSAIAPDYSLYPAPLFSSGYLANTTYLPAYSDSMSVAASSAGSCLCSRISAICLCFPAFWSAA